VRDDQLVQTTSRWAMPLAAGATAGAVVILFVISATPAPWPAALACGVLAASLIGSLIERQARARRELVRTAAGNLPPDAAAAAFHAAGHGEIPADPAVREAALKIARHQLSLTPPKSVALTIFPLFGATAVMIASTNAPGWVLVVFALPAALALICTGVLTWQAFSRANRLRERIRLLST
jgi:hypothetical protein